MEDSKTFLGRGTIQGAMGDAGHKQGYFGPEGVILGALGQIRERPLFWEEEFL